MAFLFGTGEFLYFAADHDLCYILADEDIYRELVHARLRWIAWMWARVM